MANLNTATISPTRSGLKSITFSWTANSSGTVTITTPNMTGYVTGLETVPDATDVPTANYDIEVRNALGTDLFNAEANNRSATLKEIVQPIWQGFTVAVPVVNSALSLVVTNAGSGKSGTAVLFIHETK